MRRATSCSFSARSMPGRAPPLGEGPRRRRHRAVHVGRPRARRGVDQLLGGRVHDLEHAAVRRVAPLTGHPHPAHVPPRFPAEYPVHAPLRPVPRGLVGGAHRRARRRHAARGPRNRPQPGPRDHRHPARGPAALRTGTATVATPRLDHIAASTPCARTGWAPTGTARWRPADWTGSPPRARCSSRRRCTSRSRARPTCRSSPASSPRSTAFATTCRPRWPPTSPSSPPCSRRPASAPAPLSPRSCSPASPG